MVTIARRRLLLASVSVSSNWTRSDAATEAGNSAKKGWHLPLSVLLIILHPLEKIARGLRFATFAAGVEMAAVVGALLQHAPHSARHAVLATRKQRVGPLEVAAAPDLFDAAPKKPVLSGAFLACAQKLCGRAALALLL